MMTAMLLLFKRAIPINVTYLHWTLDIDVRPGRYFSSSNLSMTRARRVAFQHSANAESGHSPREGRDSNTDAKDHN